MDSRACSRGIILELSLPLKVTLSFYVGVVFLLRKRFCWRTSPFQRDLCGKAYSHR